ncbi:hypothetical protein E2320_002287 [Naja naja]|nr:hypothetical protein E2320_002287 [Naja naja]
MDLLDQATLPDLLDQATLPDPFIDRPLTAARESRAMDLEWRAATGPIGPMGDHNEPAEWQYQTVMCSQIFKDLPDQLEQLIIRHESRSQQRRQIPTRRDQEGNYCCGRSSTIISFAPESGIGWIREQAQMRPVQAVAQPPLPQAAPCAIAPTPFKTMFDGKSACIFPG